MIGFPAEVWTVIGLLSAAGVLGMLHALASYVGNEVYAHETRLKVARLRRQYYATLATEKKPAAPENWSDVELVDDAAPPAHPARLAA